MFKKQVTRPITTVTPTREYRGQRQAQLRLDGQLKWVPVNATGRAVVETADYYAKVRQPDGSVKTLRLARDKAAALQILAEHRRKRARVEAGLEKDDTVLDADLVDLIAKFHASRAAKKTTAEQSAGENRLLRVCEGLRWKTLVDVRLTTAMKLDAWASGLNGATGTQKKQLGSLRQSLVFLRKRQLIAELIDLPTPRKLPPIIRRAIPSEQVEQLANANPDRALVIWVAFCTLARKGSLAALTAEDCHLDDPKKAWISFAPEFNKTSTGLAVPIPERLVEPLRALCLEKPVGRLFALPYLKQFIADLARAGLPRKNAEGVLVFHSLRHSGATHLVKKGLPLHLIQRIGGWSSLSVLTVRYSHLCAQNGRELLAAAFE